MAARVAAIVLGSSLALACTPQGAAPSGASPAAAPGATSPASGAKPSAAPGAAQPAKPAAKLAGTPAAKPAAPAFVPTSPVPHPPPLDEWIVKARQEVGAPTKQADEVRGLPAPVLFLDVREAREVAVSKIPGAMPLTSEAAREEFLRKFPAGTTLLVYDTVGYRSAQYARRLNEAGAQAFNIEGGLCAWVAAGARIVDARDQATRRLHAGSDELAPAVPQGYVPVVD